MNYDDVPMMFRAQIGGRCQLQRVDSNQKYQDAEIWVDEWMAVFDINIDDNNNNNEIPEFGSQVQIWEYKIKWRLVSNCGQDEGFIRPIIGAKGFPYFSGSSMKGAFIRACKQIYGKEQGKKIAERYCGKKLADGSSEPGILRFHGAYPINIDWTENQDNLVDVIHSQEEKQVIKDKITNANSQISLHNAILKFGFSSNKDVDDTEWNIIKQIWERALAHGLGSRVSAGYGYFISQDNHLINHPDSDLLLKIRLKGQGAISKLVSQTPEFRPNMFKAVLRGHTLRLLGGMTDERIAKEITKKLWGGFAGSKGSIVGILGVNFDFEPSQIISDKNYYELTEGNLNIFCMHPYISDLEKEKLTQIAKALVKFAMLFGGFGKSWRRADHKIFNSTYTKHIIGCHWQYLDESEYYPINKIEDITKYINEIRNVINGCINWILERDRSNQNRPNQTIANQNRIDTSQHNIDWREAWYSPKVQVWAHFAENGQSQAIRWFHDSYNGKDTIKKTLAGSMGCTGRIWHRMYPHFITNDIGEITRGKGYVEILTFFPDNSEEMKGETEKFLNFLKDRTDFRKVW